MKKTSLLIITIFMINCSALQESNGWVSLFNGQDLDGWHVKNVPADDSLSCWNVQDGAIECNSLGHPEHDYIWLLTDKEYADFSLRLQFQMYRNTSGNSGVQIRSRYDDAAGWLDGPQIDVHPLGPWRTGMSWDETRGNQWWLYPSNVPRDSWVDSTMAVPGMVWFYSDEGTGWNDLEITAIGTRFYAVLNGVPVMQYDGTGVLDDSTHQARNVGMRGHIALQIHKGDETRVRYRNLLIKEYQELAE